MTCDFVLLFSNIGPMIFRSRVFLLLFSSSSFVGKGAKEVNSLSSCTSENAFILLSHVIYAMDNIEVEHFF